MSSIRIKKSEIEKSIEKNIITQMIIDDSVCSAIVGIAKPEHFEISHLKILLVWIKNYHESFGQAPNDQIQDVFRVNSRNISSEDAEIIQDLLIELSDQYVSKKENKNSQFYINEALAYIKKQSYLRLSERISSFVKLDQVQEAEQELIKHKNISVKTSGCINPDDEDFVIQTMSNRKTDFLFTIPGPLGEVVRPERGRLFSVLAPPKTGKTFFLNNLGFLARMERLKVFECNCEMSATKLHYRTLKRMTGCSEEAGKYTIPISDCKANQIGVCQKRERVNKIKVINNVGDIVPFSDAPIGYTTCTACKDTKNNKDFKLAIWYEEIERPALTLDRAVKATKSLNLMYGRDTYRLKSYPKFSATVQDIINDLDFLAYSEGFYPDVLIVDYADILKPIDSRSENRFALDEIWKNLGRIATERNIFVATASQTNRTGSQQKNIDGSVIAEAFSKAAHVDSFCALVSTPIEKTNGLLRVSNIYNRDGEADPHKQVLLFQNLALGQPFLNSEWVGEYDSD